VSAYIDLEANVLHYYDSFGSEPSNEIATFMNTLSAQLTDFHDAPCAVRTNTARHQFKNTECGVYSMFFIASMLDGTSYDDFVANGLTDAQMNRYRKTFYSTLNRFDKTGSDSNSASNSASTKGIVGGGTRTRRTHTHHTRTRTRTHTHHTRTRTHRTRTHRTRTRRTRTRTHRKRKLFLTSS
jgi:hypothetical protein